MDVGHAAVPVAFGSAALVQHAPSFDEVYEHHFDFVWRSARRLGVDPSSVDDVVQEVFVVVHRRLSSVSFESTMKAWLYGVTVGVVRNHLRSIRRRGHGEPLSEQLVADAASPSDRLLLNEAAQALHSFLQTLSDERREVFVMVDLEQESVASTAAALAINANTAQGRLRAAREELDKFLQRRRAAESRRNA